MSLSLAYGLRFDDLYRRDGLVRLDGLFLDSLAAADAGLAGRLAAARAEPPSAADEADLLIALAPHLDDFVAGLFAIRAEWAALAAAHAALAPLLAVKRQLVQRRAAKAFPPAQAAGFDGPALAAELGLDPTDELAFAGTVAGWLDGGAPERLELATRYAAWALASDQGWRRHRHGVLFRLPGKQDPFHLVHPPADDEMRRRDGFALTDAGADLTAAMDQVHYCILCHHQGKDSCSKGLPDKKRGGFARNALGHVQAGCPLEERISEMHEVKAQGLSRAALALAVVDNPMLAGTGHRICNDCMTACIYQNQNKDPVDIPQVETRVLKDVLGLPWGFEIYSLLTRWNPLDLRRPLPRPDSGRKVLVAGLGPAGFTLAHHLLNDGHWVVAVDGLKIEPLAPALSGIGPAGQRVPFRPVRDLAELAEPLGRRVMAGFGGVAEYGITVRWDKNFLKVIRLLLERRGRFAMFGGVRLGGALTIDGALAEGFDHVALCLGAGRPTVLGLPGGLARGVRQASDFLMALQLTGAARTASIANLQLRLPVVVIGGGLTAIDTCTEALAYYPVQVEKFLARYEVLTAERGETAVRAGWSDEEAEIADEFLGHARTLRTERRPERVAALLRDWGGATIAYRRTLVEAPAYRNHEEINKALEEGIRIAEGLAPLAIEVDRHGHAAGLRVRDGAGAETVLPARAVLVAAGTVPNTVLAREESGLALDGKYFQAIDGDGLPLRPEPGTKPAAAEVLMRLDSDGRGVSFFGDLHPSWAGNVVSAMASAKRGYPVVSRLLEAVVPRELGGAELGGAELVARLNRELRARVHAVNVLCPGIVEVVVEAPAAARAFQPGQFYRLQNFETLAPVADGTVLAMEGLALTGAWVDAGRGLVSLIVLEMGGSSDLCRHLAVGEPVVLMGPTGTPTRVGAGETVLLAGGGLGNAVLFSIAAACRRAGGRVLYFAGYRRAEDRFKVAEIEAAADVVVWCVDRAPGFAADPARPQDRAFVGNIVAAMAAYGEGRLGPAAIPLSAVDRVIAIGSDRMMAAVTRARHEVLAPLLRPGHQAIGSINSPMQCMMKEICGQCLQRQRDPETGQERVVFTCFDQDQPLDLVDFEVLRQRLGQNGVHEKLTRLWIDRCLKSLGRR